MQILVLSLPLPPLSSQAALPLRRFVFESIFEFGLGFELEFGFGFVKIISKQFMEDANIEAVTSPTAR